ncbi:MAG: biliverdin-producing heme oxygenase [Lentilitoribacter sp.]
MAFEVEIPTKNEKNNMRLCLKHETQALHNNAEKLVDDLDIFKCQKEYIFWLRTMLRLHSRYALCCDEVAGAFGLRKNQTNLIAALQGDLQALSEECVDPIMRHNSTNFNKMIGITYVLEGSAMGAQILHKQAVKSGLVNVRYMNSLRENAHPRWSEFVEKLNQCTSGYNEIKSGAVLVFEDLISQLDEYNNE